MLLHNYEICIVYAIFTIKIDLLRSGNNICIILLDFYCPCFQEYYAWHVLSCLVGHSCKKSLQMLVLDFNEPNPLKTKLHNNT